MINNQKKPEEGNEGRMLEEEEAKRVTGGSFIDDVICAVVGHDYKEVAECGRGSSPTVYVKWVCKRCGKVRYEKRVPGSGIVVEISEEEYNVVMGW